MSHLTRLSSLSLEIGSPSWILMILDKRQKNISWHLAKLKNMSGLPMSSTPLSNVVRNWMDDISRC